MPYHIGLHYTAYLGSAAPQISLTYPGGAAPLASRMGALPLRSLFCTSRLGGRRAASTSASLPLPSLLFILVSLLSLSPFLLCLPSSPLQKLQ